MLCLWAGGGLDCFVADLNQIKLTGSSLRNPVPVHLVFFLTLYDWYILSPLLLDFFLGGGFLPNIGQTGISQYNYF